MNIESILLFESERVDYLYPFSILHCAWEVRCGALMLFEKIQKQFPEARIIYKGRDKHVNSFLPDLSINLRIKKRKYSDSQFSTFT